MTVFHCSACGHALTPDLTALPAVPTVPDLDLARPEGARKAPPTVPRGSYAIETEPWGAPFVPQEDQDDPVPSQPRGLCRAVGDHGFVISAGPRDTIVVHPEDASVLQPLPGWANSTGCCGPEGTEGPNRACPCGARIATLAADCTGPYELHLDPLRTRASTRPDTAG
ncbi:hypothetical protein BCL76_105451 [Streptomyces sp. CG 926]|uniref:hypothetical protein n=1 Tax=Streptomyces sp. CG 926 TaxID=1882405 RepID=UPI000D6B054F|nr:hypothetical protein [Streptomyces sp. CG 926]PWK70496.1 hypothetical protein BCL76_105451 [Streptomyces sp. CG 926]